MVSKKGIPANPKIPKWVKQNYSLLVEGLTCKGDFESLWKNYSNLSTNLSLLTEVTTMLEIRTLDAGFFKKTFKNIDPQIPLDLLIESMISKNFYTQFHKTKAIIAGLDFALESGNHLVATFLIRSLLEEICYHKYSLSKVEPRLDKIAKGFQSYMKGLKKKKHISDIALKELVQNKVDTIMYLNDVYSQGSDSHIKNVLGSMKLSNDMAGEGTKNKRLHIMDTIRGTEKTTNVPVVKYYDLLSEMTHPNFGSRTLVIRNRDNAEQPVGDIKLSHNGNSIDQSLYFYDLASPILSELTKLSLETINRSNSILNYYRNLYHDNLINPYILKLVESSQPIEDAKIIH